MRTHVAKYLGPTLGLALFVTALGILYQALNGYTLHAILKELQQLPTRSLLMAAGLALLSYLIMTCYDVLSLRYIQQKIAYPRIALASFIGYAFSNNIGLSMVAGASVRYRLYSGWGLSAEEITKVILFCTLTLWLGFLAVGGLVFMFDPMTLPAGLSLPLPSVRLLGVCFMLLVIGYLLMSCFWRKPVAIKGWKFEWPANRLVLPQLLIAGLDWVLAGAVLFVLLPTDLGFGAFLGIYLFAQMAGLLSQIPGGIGVFEAVIVLMLGPLVTPSAVLGSLFAYRIIYYLLPLLLAAVLLGTHEVVHKKDELQKGVRILTQWIPQVMPSFMALTVFIAGAILLVSGSVPGENSRLQWLGKLVPLSIIEISNFLDSLIGVALLLLARGLQRRLDVAYVLTCVLLGLGALLSVFKGLHYETAIGLLTVLLALLPCHWCFYRKAKLTSETFTPGWIAAITLIALLSVWLGFFSLKHVEYSNDLWWQFALDAQAPRLLRALVGGMVMLLIVVTLRLMKPVSETLQDAVSPADIERARAILGQAPEAYANLVLLKDKALLFSSSGKSFLMYAIVGQSWVVMGDPVGPREEWQDLVWHFCELCERSGGWPVFYEVAAANLSMYVDLGLTLLKLGEEARVDLKTFTLEGSKASGLRQTNRRLPKEGCEFAVIQPEATGAIMPELRQVSKSWLANKKTSEKGFSLGFFDEDYLSNFPIAVVRKQGRIIAFANMLTGANQAELSADLMRQSAEAPNSVMEYLFLQMILWAQSQGYQWFNLGMAPLSGLETHALAPLWNRVGGYIFGHAEQFYNFQGLRQFKQKFDPEWKPRYLASPAAFLLPRVLIDIASLISGGLKAIILK